MSDDVGESKDGAASAAGRERAILLTLAAVQFISIVDFMVIMPLGPQLLRTMAIRPDQFGLVVSSYTIAAGVAGLVASTLIDRFGRRAAFLGLYSGFLVGTLLCGLAPGYMTLMAARVLTGAFGGLLGGIAMTIISEVFPEHRRSRATGALMSAFALASVAGVPIGMVLGTRFGWHTTFLALAAIGTPVLFVGAWAMPPLRDHVSAISGHPLARLAETFARPGHLWAFSLMIALTFGGFVIFPNMSLYMVRNVGITEERLPLIYVVGGALTLVGAPAAGRLADRFGKLPVFRLISPLSGLMMLVVTHLPRAAAAWAPAAVGGLMVCNAGRMVAALPMITGSVEPRRRGGFMSVNSSLQHLASGLGAYVGGLLLVEAPDGLLRNFNAAGYLGAAATLLTLWLAGKLRPAGPDQPISPAMAFAAAAESEGDASDPLAVIDLGTG